VDAEPTTGNPAVNIVLTADGALAFDALAAAHQDERLAIVVDGIVVSAPTINETRFGGRAILLGPRATDRPRPHPGAASARVRAACVGSSPWS
jgi:preprotein translocase subunit SecD